MSQSSIPTSNPANKEKQIRICTFLIVWGDVELTLVLNQKVFHVTKMLSEMQEEGWEKPPTGDKTSQDSISYNL